MSFTLIETKTLVSAAASIEFTSIPQTFTDLVLLASIRDDRSSNANGFNLIVNGSTAGSSNRFLFGTGSSTGSASGGQQLVNANSATANTFGNLQIYIPNYTGATQKSFSIDAVSENNATEAFMAIVAGLSTVTAALTSVGMSMDSAFGGSNFLAGSTISLYGILKGSDGIVTTS